jgi:trichothecene 3-O-acetyltransferase
MENVGDRLDILGEQAGLFKLYTQLCLCFRMTDDTLQAAIVNKVTHGLERLAASYPWVAGQVVNSKPDEYRIAPYEKIPRLVVKDVRADPSMQSMEALREARFPISMLDESAIAHINTLAAGTEGPAPIFVVQANFVKGGLLLVFVAQHNLMDMTGMDQVMHLLSKACHDQQFTPEEIRIGNLDRHNLIPLLDEFYTPGPELSRQIAKPVETDRADEITSPPPECVWTYFLFPSASLANLKSSATKSLTNPLSFVSTDDVLSAFIWQRISRARLPRLTPSDETTFARAIDPRRYLDIPATYPGLVQNMTYTTSTFEHLINEPLGKIASQLRKEVDPKTSNLAYATRALTTAFHRAEDKSTIGVTSTLDLGKDIMLSSWAKYASYRLDFNLGLGKPEAVRRPGFTPVESLFYLMPKRGDGEVAAALCLRLEDLGRLRKDEEFMRVAEYIG